VYAEAAVLLTGLVRSHAFASGNRRTALLTTKDFLLSNDAPFNVPDDPATASALQGVREGFYTPQAIQQWLRTGAIHAFTRTTHSQSHDRTL
jgi:prophage maintenance system killer protein